MTSHTITGVFWVHLKGYSYALDRKNQFQHWGQKEGVCFEQAYGTKTFVPRISIPALHP